MATATMIRLLFDTSVLLESDEEDSIPTYVATRTAAKMITLSNAPLPRQSTAASRPPRSEPDPRRPADASVGSRRSRREEAEGSDRSETSSSRPHRAAATDPRGAVPVL